MNITLAPKLKPGASCKVSGTTAAKSTVYLLGVDQRATLLGLGNDIDKKRLNDDMNSYNAHENYESLQITGNTDRYLELGESNTLILTNALSGSAKCLTELRSEQTEFVREDDDESDLEETENANDPNFPKVRRNFPETWIFDKLEANDKGEFSLTRRVPDSITSFLISGFSVHPDTGLGIAIKQKLTVFQDFFLKLNLPYSIRLGEVLKVDVSVFNYVKKSGSITADVTIMNDGSEFEFVDASKSGKDCKISVLSKQSVKVNSVTVYEGSGSSTYFLIRALRTGQIKIKVKAIAENRGDEVERMMLVENEGITVVKNKVFPIDLRNKSADSIDFDIAFVENAITKSIAIEASVIGDLLGPAIDNVHKLLCVTICCKKKT